MFWGALAGLGLGGLKNILHDKPQYEKDAKLASEITRGSPWTGMPAKMPQAPTGLLGSAMQGGLTGAMIDQMMGNTWGGGAGAGEGVSSGIRAGGPSLGVNTDLGYGGIPTVPKRPWSLLQNRFGAR